MNLPPLHASMVHLPVALIPLSVVADCIGFTRNSVPARIVGYWSLMAAWAGTVLSVLFGYVDLYRALAQAETVPMLPYVHLHLKVGWIILILISVLGVWRMRIFRVQARGHRGYLGVATFLLLIAVFQGWYGGELVYTGGVGVTPARRGLSNPLGAAQTLSTAHRTFSSIPGLGTDSPPLGLRERADEAAKKPPVDSSAR